jgi:ribosomal protein L3 glutamine methyltransferase
VSDTNFPDNNAGSAAGGTMVTRNEYPTTVGGMIEWCAQELERGDVFCGHGTDNVIDEAASLVCAVAGLEHAAAISGPQAFYTRALPGGVAVAINGMLRQRIEQRLPLPYLLKEAWFAGLPFYVDERVLVPRSPFAELIAAHFEPWLEPSSVRRILDIGTGSGCIAIALARAFPASHVVAVDLMPDALDVARINVTRHAVQDRVELVQSDLFEQVEGTFDLIVSNPPYVAEGEVTELPPEYSHEPNVGLFSGADGLDSSRRILQDAARYLTDDGMLAIEVGDGAARLDAAFSKLGFIWLEFESGGEGVALLSAAELRAGL